MNCRAENAFKIVVVVSAFILLFVPFTALALRGDTHYKLNEYIAKNTFNSFSLDGYLKNYLGVQNGVETSLGDKNVYEWLSHGGEAEDSSVGFRYLNHFLDPIDNTGLWGHESAANWALAVEGVQSIVGEDYSWNDARAYYFKALTSPDSYMRRTSFAKTFRALGQVMHLVQDMSVPEHVRNDAHGFGSAYEKWAASKNAPAVDTYALYIPFTPGPDYPLSVANLFDTDRYTGVNPKVTTENTTIGLAEYTNANFLSPDTIFSSFPYPVYAGMTAEVLDGDKLYLVKAENAGTDKYLALAQNFYTYLPQDYKKLALTTKDTAVHTNYANHLIPRAIGYSSQVLSYFFRGDMGLAADGNGCYIVNNLDEGIEGAFELFYDNSSDKRVPVKDVDKRPWVYGAGVAGQGESSALPLFAIPQDAKTPGEYLLVCKGGMGNETTNAVAGSRLITPVIGISLPPEGYYAFTDKHPYYKDTSDSRYMDDPANQGFDKIIINVKNITPEAGEMSGGTVALQVRYRQGLADQFKSAPGETDGVFSQIVAEKKNVSIQGDTFTRLEFDLPRELPLWATDVHLFLVYNGTVGAHDVLGLGYRDISEPTPVDFINLMDKICMNNTLYKAGSADAIAIVDGDGDGVPGEWEGDEDGIANPGEWDVYPHGIKNLSIRFAPSSSWSYNIASIAPGDSVRVFFLGEYARTATWLGYSLSTATYRGLSVSDGALFRNAPYRSSSTGCNYAD